MNDREMLVSFSLVCHANNVSRVRNLLVDLGMTSIVSDGTEIHGMCEMSELQGIVKALSKSKIVDIIHETELTTRSHLSSKKRMLN